MKRDMDLIRAILLAIEDDCNGLDIKPIRIPNYSADVIGYHSELILEAGLACGSNLSHLGSTYPEIQFSRLTWSGHEFVDSARDDTTWKQASGMVKQKAGTIALTVLQALLSDLTMRSLGLKN